MSEWGRPTATANREATDRALEKIQFHSNQGAGIGGMERCGARDERNDQDEWVLKGIWVGGREGGRDGMGREEETTREGGQDIGKRRRSAKLEIRFFQILKVYKNKEILTGKMLTLLASSGREGPRGHADGQNTFIPVFLPRSHSMFF